MNSSLPPSMEFETGNGTDVGGLLRASRMRRNEALADVAKILRIRLVYMEAIEDGRFDDLPGNTYAIGFIRSYSEHLGLDGEEIVRRFKSEATEDDNKQSLRFPTVVPENGIPRGAIVMVGLLIAVFGYGSWYFVSTQDHFATEQVTPVPAQIAVAVSDGSPKPEPVPRIEPSSAAASPAQPIADIETPPPSMQPMPSEPTPNFASAPESPQPVVDTPMEIQPALELVSPPITSVEAVVERPVVETPAPMATEIAPPTTTSEATGDDKTVKPGRIQSAFIDVVPGGVSASETAPAKAKEVVIAPPQIPEIPATDAPDSGLVDLTEAPDTTDTSDGHVTSAAPDAANIDEAPVQHVAPVEVATAPTATEKPKSRITVRAAGVSWIQIRDNAANQLIVMKLLQRGESYDVPNQEGLSMGTGNAGVLEITVDGAKVPAVGPVGAVRRNILLDVDRLREGTAVIK